MKIAATIARIVTIGSGLIISAVVCSATLISVPDYSFETDALADGVSTTSPSVWTASPGATAGLYNPVDAQFANATDTGITSGNLAAPADAKQIGFANTAGGYLQQTLTGVSVLPNTRYTLTVAIGNRGDFPGGGNAMGDFKIELYAGATLLTSTNGNGEAFAPNYGFADAVASYISPWSGLPGGDLRIVLSNTSNFPQIQSIFDNVRLDATTIPEPSSLLLLGVGGWLLLARRGSSRGEGGYRRLRP